jgi:hypothetical protein
VHAGRRTFGGILVAVFFAALLYVPSAQALQLDRIDGNFTEPIFVTSDPNDEDRIFVVEKGGAIITVEDGQQRTFLEIPGGVAGGYEEGLLSMAFDPGFAENRRFYVFYVPAGGETVEIAEFLEAPNGLEADEGSLRPVGPDGYLYISTGDGAVNENAQDLTSLLGKVLRIDPDPSGGQQYTIPSDNPFAGPTAGRDEIWSYGLRNPWRFSFDRETGAFTLGDVGEQNWEELNYRQAVSAGGDGGGGLNFGWRCRQGAHEFFAGDECTGFTGGTDPVFEYEQSTGHCAITGGYVSRDPGTPSVLGRYVYADYCLGRVRSLNPGTGAPLAATDDRYEGIDIDLVPTFGEDACGRLYVTSLSANAVFRLEDATPTTAAECAPVVEPPPIPDPPVTETGPCAPSDVLGTNNADRLRGGAGDDRLTGRGGKDRMGGGGGPDCLDGGAGSDRLAGDGGADEIYGGGGGDEISGGGGADEIDVRGGGKDEVSCGGGKDKVKADRRDDVVKSCEKVRRGG